jgi:hypothetical protein
LLLSPSAAAAAAEEVETEAVCMLQARPDARSVSRAIKASQLKRRHVGFGHTHSHGEVAIHDVNAPQQHTHAHGGEPCQHAH